MRKFLQTRYGIPGGNCFETAVACIIEDEELTRCYFGEEGWYDTMVDYLKQRGYQFTWWRAGQGDIPPGYCVAGGKTAGGRLHSVVWSGVKMVHDPHPRNTGLATIEQWFLVYREARAARKEAK